MASIVAKPGVHPGHLLVHIVFLLICLLHGRRALLFICERLGVVVHRIGKVFGVELARQFDLAPKAYFRISGLKMDTRNLSGFRNVPVPPAVEAHIKN